MVTKVKGGVLDESALSGKNMTGDIAFDTTTLKIDSSNNRVGVGTASPAALLHLSGDSDNGDEACQIVLNDEDSSAGSRVPSIQFKGNNTNIGRIRGTDTQGIIMSGSSAQGDDLVVQAGYVGIGTTSPSAPLEINANLERQLELVRTTTTTGAVYQRLTNDGGNYYIGADSSAGDRLAIGGQAYALTLTTESARPIVFATTNTTRMTIDSSGNVGIGTASPAQKLHVSGEVKATSADITDTSGNTSIGYGALNNLTSGDSNVAVGYESLEDVTDGTHNVSMGYRTAMNITGGDYNTAVGNYALTTLTTQSYNTAVGYYALGGATTGQHDEQQFTIDVCDVFIVSMAVFTVVLCPPGGVRFTLRFHPTSSMRDRRLLTTPQRTLHSLGPQPYRGRQRQEHQQSSGRERQSFALCGIGSTQESER